MPNIKKTKKKPVETKNIGKIFRGETKYIDKDNKKHRNYLVVRDKKNGNVEVAKLKSIKKFDKDNKNADAALMELDQKKYGFKNRTGVDFQRFGRNRITRKDLNVNPNNGVFETPEVGKLTSHDTHSAVVHTSTKKKKSN